MGSVPVGVQCPLASSLVEFLGYWDWLWYPGFRPCWCPSPFPSPSISQCYSIHYSLPAIGFHLCFSLRPGTHSVDPSLTHFLGEFPGLGLALVSDVVDPEAEQGCAWSRNLKPNLCRSRREDRADSCLDMSSQRYFGVRPCWDLATRRKALHLIRVDWEPVLFINHVVNNYLYYSMDMETTSSIKYVLLQLHQAPLLSLNYSIPFL